MYCLCLDGGGASGYMTIKFLERLEEVTETPICKHFDLITGVSTGAILGQALACGMPAKDVVQLYKEFIPNIFVKRNPISDGFRQLFIGKYDPMALEYGLSVILSRCADYKTRFMCYSTCITQERKATFFKSWRTDNTLNTKDAIIASCSAPTFFRPHKDGNDYYMDGCFLANNTSMCALSEAVKLLASLDNLYLLNIQVGSNWTVTPNRARWLQGALAWLFPLPGAVIDCGAEIVEYQAHQLIGFRNHVVRPRMYPGIDCSDFKMMDKLVEEMWEFHRETILNKLVVD